MLLGLHMHRFPTVGYWWTANRLGALSGGFAPGVEASPFAEALQPLLQSETRGVTGKTLTELQNDGEGKGGEEER